MKPSRVLYDAIANLLAGDTGTLAGVAALKVHLAKANFTPSLDLVIGTLVEATFTGSGAKEIVIGTQTVYYDPLTGALTIELREPAGGLHWQCTVTPSPAETIYGWYVTDNASAVLLGSDLFVTPIPIAAAGEGLDLGYITLKFSPTSPS